MLNKHRVTALLLVAVACTLPFAPLASAGESSDRSDKTAVAFDITVEGGTVEPGGTVTLAFTATNEGEEAASNVHVEAQAPRSWSIAAHTDDGGQFAGRGIGWAWGSLDAGQSVSPTVTLSVPENASTGEVTIQAFVGDADRNTATNETTVTVDSNGGGDDGGDGGDGGDDGGDGGDGGDDGGDGGDIGGGEGGDGGSDGGDDGDDGGDTGGGDDGGDSGEGDDGNTDDGENGNSGDDGADDDDSDSGEDIEDGSNGDDGDNDGSSGGDDDAASGDEGSGDGDGSTEGDSDDGATGNETADGEGDVTGNESVDGDTDGADGDDGQQSSDGGDQSGEERQASDEPASDPASGANEGADDAVVGDTGNPILDQSGGGDGEGLLAPIGAMSTPVDDPTMRTADPAFWAVAGFAVVSLFRRRFR